MEYHELNKFVLEHYQQEKENFLFIDEVQLCTGFEKAINSLHNSKKFHIYITGSNAFLLSSDLATLFTGRTFEIPVFPFSFAEYSTYFEGNNKEELLTSYVKEGGMAGSFTYSTEQQKYSYIKDVFSALIVRDIKRKYNIRNTSLLEKLNTFLMDNISTEVSTQKLARTLTSTQQKTNNKTISSYLSYLCNAFAFYKIRRYDIRGKKYLASQDKYYLADHSFRYAILGTKNMDYGRIYENIVAIELLRRGYEVYTGVLYKKEIDFVAIRQNDAAVVVDFHLTVRAVRCCLSVYLDMGKPVGNSHRGLYSLHDNDSLVRVDNVHHSFVAKRLRTGDAIVHSCCHIHMRRDLRDSGFSVCSPHAERRAEHKQNEEKASYIHSTLGFLR